jgi:hypothetical protein
MSTSNSMYEWKTLPWKKIERQVFKLQKRIYQASSRAALTHEFFHHSRNRGIERNQAKLV